MQEVARPPEENRTAHHKEERMIVVDNKLAMAGERGREERRGRRKRGGKWSTKDTSFEWQMKDLSLKLQILNFLFFACLVYTSLKHPPLKQAP